MASISLKTDFETSLMVQWLRFHARNGGPGFDPSQRLQLICRN